MVTRRVSEGRTVRRLRPSLTHRVTIAIGFIQDCSREMITRRFVLQDRKAQRVLPNFSVMCL